MIDLEAFRMKEHLRRKRNMTQVKKQSFVIKPFVPDSLHIVYVLTHVGVCGGTKIILEHANRLVSSGHRVTLVAHFDKPDWFLIHKNVHYVQVPFSIELTWMIPDCDVIVATYWREISECVARNIAPVVYFEQGDFHLFDWEQVSEEMQEYIMNQYQLAPFIFTVSKNAARLIDTIFRRQATVIHNGYDDRIFYPKINKNNAIPRIIAIGSEHVAFKGIAGIKEALQVLAQQGHRYKFVLISPDESSDRTHKTFVNPTQATIGRLLRESDILVCNSRYESFCLPVLEAMASGCAVITTRNIGVNEYAQERVNCLMTAINNDCDELAATIASLLDDRTLRDFLASRGLKTAEQFRWNRCLPQLIQYYRGIARYRTIREGR